MNTDASDQRISLESVLLPSSPSLHPTPQPNLDKLESRRRRSRRACEPCRQRKRKCDGHEPCKTCVEFEYECYYATSGRKKAGLVKHYASSNPRYSTSPVQASRHVRPEAHREEAPPFATTDSSFEQPSILDPLKVRYMSASSAVAFPRILGLDMDRQHAPRLHAFGWNLGTRKENQLKIWTAVDLIGFEDIKALAKIYFAVIHPHLGFLDPDVFDRTCEARWAGGGDRTYDAIICGVGALGSLFSGVVEGHPQETTMADFAKTSLVDAPARCNLTPNHVSAYLLQAIYLRCIARPSAAWLATCQAMHLLEAAGLHRSIPSITVVHPIPPPLNQHESDYRRRLACFTFLINKMFSYEYGRSSVYLSFNVGDPDPQTPDSFPHDLLKLARALPSEHSDPGTTAESKVASLKAALASILTTPTATGVRTLFKVDFVLAVYRRLYLLRTVLSPSDISDIVELCKESKRIIHTIIEEGRPWWMLSNTSLQIICACLALDTPLSLSVAYAALDVLAVLKARWDTRATEEVNETAHALMNMTRARKEKSLRALDGTFEPADDNVNNHNGRHEVDSTAENSALQDEVTFFEWPDFSFNWDSVFNE